MTDPASSNRIQQYVQAWVGSLAQVLGQLGVASPVVAASPLQPAPAISAALMSRLQATSFAAGGALAGTQLWTGETPVALRLAQLLMSEPANHEAEFTDTHRDAFAEFLRQVAGLAASTWKAESGAPAEINFQDATPPSFPSSQSSTITFSAAEFPELSLQLLIDTQLADALAALPAAPEVPAPAASAPEDPAPAAAAPAAAAQAASAPLHPSNLDLLLDVELEATIRFGARDLLLRDIFGLMPGAVVELDQLVNDPAELLVAGRLVARGEVVVVEGNFGLRVTEVASPSERASVLPV